MPKVVDAAAQRREIRRAARRVFGRRGVRGTGLAHVARAAGMGRSSLYHYYPDKRSLVRDLQRDLLEEEAALFAAAVDGAGTAVERVQELLRTNVALFDEWVRLAPLVFDLRASQARGFRAFFERLRDSLGSVIAAGQASGQIARALDPRLAAAVLIGAIDGLLLQHFADPEAFGDRRSLADELARTARRMLAP